MFVWLAEGRGTCGWYIFIKGNIFNKCFLVVVISAIALKDKRYPNRRIACKIAYCCTVVRSKFTFTLFIFPHSQVKVTLMRGYFSSHSEKSLKMNLILGLQLQKPLRTKAHRIYKKNVLIPIHSGVRRKCLWFKALVFSTNPGKVFKKDSTCSGAESTPSVTRKEPKAQSRE